MIKRIGVAGGLLVAVVLVLGVIGISSASALQLPDISISLPGSEYPLHLNYESKTVATELEDANGGILSGKGLKLLLLIGLLTALGTFQADFANVEETAAPNKKCHTSGDPTATVLTEGSFHVVIINTSPLEIGLLFLPNEVTIECEGVKFKVKGSVISSIEGITSTSDETSILGRLEKGANPGEQKIKEYYNNEGTKVKAKLTTIISSIEHESNEQVKEDVTLLALPTSVHLTELNMFEITNW